MLLGIIRYRFPAAGWDINTALQVPVDIEDTPVVFPILAVGVVNDFPGLVQSFEPVEYILAFSQVENIGHGEYIPEILRSIGQSRANPVG